MRINAWMLLFVAAGMLVLGCSPKARYDRRLKRELASGERHDSIFMGLHLGMTDKEFYTRCWLLNREGLIQQGTQNMTVEYDMREELDHPATMNFYPEFSDGRIANMPVRYSYNGWAPWNRKMQSDRLMEDLLDWYRKEYGRGWIAVEHPRHGPAHVKLDGNRRITLFRGDEIAVWAVFTDMSAPGAGNLQDQLSSD